MATASSAEHEETECPICSEEFNEPKILPCTHILCKKCLIRLLDADTEALCPLCRSTIADVDVRLKKSAQGIADALPTDLALAAVVKSSAILRGVHLCCVCPNIAAVALCIDCNDMLCRPCATGHRKLRMSRHHEVEDLAILTAERLAARGTPECPVHNEELCKLYCTSHAVSICRTCATTKHRSCPQVVELDEKAKEAHAVFDEILSGLRTQEAELGKAASEANFQLEMIDAFETTSLEDINKMYNRLKASLDKRHQELKVKIKDNSSEARAVVLDDKASVSTQQGRLKSHKRLVERARESTPYSDLGDMAQALQNRVKDLDFSLPKSQFDMKTIQIDPKLVSQIEDSVKSLGHLAGTCEESSTQRLSQTHDNVPPTGNSGINGNVTSSGFVIAPNLASQTVVRPAAPVPLQGSSGVARHPQTEHSNPTQGLFTAQQTSPATPGRQKAIPIVNPLTSQVYNYHPALQTFNHPPPPLHNPSTGSLVVPARLVDPSANVSRYARPAVPRKPPLQKTDQDLSPHSSANIASTFVTISSASSLIQKEPHQTQYASQHSSVNTTAAASSVQPSTGSPVQDRLLNRFKYPAARSSAPLASMDDETTAGSSSFISTRGASATVPPSPLVAVNREMSQTAVTRNFDDAPVFPVTSPGCYVSTLLIARRSYSRQELISLQNAPAARVRPWLPDLPDICLEQATTTVISPTFPVFTPGFFVGGLQYVFPRAKSNTRFKGSQRRDAGLAYLDTVP